MFNKLNNLKSKVTTNKYVVGATTAVMVLSTSIIAHAADGDTTSITGSMQTAMNGVKTDTLSAISTVAPIGIGIMGVFLVWKYGIKFFKGISK
jgi:hypothetical protein